MILRKTYSFWSVLASVIGMLLLIASYTVAPGNPQGIIVAIIKIMMVLAIISLLLGIVLSILAIKNKENGTKKYIGILLPVSIVLYFILVPLLMAIGFMINDKP